MNVDAERKRISREWKKLRQEGEQISGGHPWWNAIKLVDIFLAHSSETTIENAGKWLEALKEQLPEILDEKCPECGGGKITKRYPEQWDGDCRSWFLIPCVCRECGHAWEGRYDYPKLMRESFDQSMAEEILKVYQSGGNFLPDGRR